MRGKVDGGNRNLCNDNGRVRSTTIWIFALLFSFLLIRYRTRILLFEAYIPIISILAVFSSSLSFESHRVWLT